MQAVQCEGSWLWSLALCSDFLVPLSPFIYFLHSSEPTGWNPPVCRSMLGHVEGMLRLLHRGSCTSCSFLQGASLLPLTYSRFFGSKPEHVGSMWPSMTLRNWISWWEKRTALLSLQVFIYYKKRDILLSAKFIQGNMLRSSPHRINNSYPGVCRDTLCAPKRSWFYLTWVFDTVNANVSASHWLLCICQVTFFLPFK